MCRPGQISQVVLNLLSNAFDATEESTERWVKIILKEKGSYVFIKVQDSGLGVEMSHLQKIFHPFFTTKDVGTGLGLSISKGIIEQHRGLIYLDRVESHTTFVIRLTAISGTIASTDVSGFNSLPN